MVNSVLKAITKQLGSVFGTDYKYYVENVEQKLIKPCFTVDTIMPIQRSKSPVLYDRTMPIVIHYFPNDKNTPKSNSYSMAEEVIEAIEYLPFKDTFLRGENISWSLVEDVLQIFITYRFTTVKVVDEVEMEILEENNISHN